ncbi:MAG: hypothetical protein LIP09_14175 [Bacteroidales bacterium]|nr:hypothetical protein [Bacteroidales bacterium]MCC8119875.1 hypothetical protein [Bacteroidales bacterium]
MKAITNQKRVVIRHEKELKRRRAMRAHFSRLYLAGELTKNEYNSELAIRDFTYNSLIGDYTWELKNYQLMQVVGLNNMDWGVMLYRLSIVLTLAMK